jgi:hypothetical protein
MVQRTLIVALGFTLTLLARLHEQLLLKQPQHQAILVPRVLTALQLKHFHFAALDSS